MKRNVLRAAGISALAAVAFGVAAPTASAATSAPASPVAVVQTVNVQQSGSLSLSASQAPAASVADVAAVQQAAASGKGKAFIELLKRTGGLFKKAVAKAKAGQKAFQSWIKKQHWTVRVAWWALSGSTQTWVIQQLASQIG